MQLKNRQVEELSRILEKIYSKPSHLFKRGFLLGVASGMGWIIGATFVVLLIGFLVSKLGGIPLIGEILERINSAVPTR